MEVIVYTKPHCVECTILKQFLDDHHVRYEVRDCGHNEERIAEVKAMGFLGVPVTIIGDIKIQGLKPDEILEALNK
ncbi:glutaredoxin family protein [Shimazuella sp. AN120528]|uniref:glutaredoxin family protein n=1 Tax=Shimazuella soli TaxID=1892854 RepID=UPI001F0F38BF|nr:glutaredoxin family protein [Shimazuella soli]MCH5585693.1 glutaredoxin family protein [Shimazuella soli]